MGYRLRRAAWNHGYATEGSCALVHRGFTGLGAERVFARSERGKVEYALTRADWRRV